MKYFLLIFLFCCSTSFANAEKSKLQLINAQIQQIQTSVDQQHQYKVDINQQLNVIETALASLEQEIHSVNQLQLNEEKKLRQLQNKQQQEQKKLTDQRTALAQHIRTAYQLGKLNEIKIILNQENANTLSRHIGYYSYMTQQRLELISQSKETLRNLNETMNTISEHQKELKKILQQKYQQQAEQESAQKIRQKLILQLNETMQTKEQQLATLIANQKALQDALTLIQTQQPINITDNKTFSQRKGKLNWPINGDFLANFGSSLDNDTSDQHLTGVIIKAPLGAPVKAISTGKVVFANWLRGFGLLIIVDHGGGYMSLYGRNQAMYAQVGDKVKSGDLIASIGNTGGYQTPGLYFEIRQNGIPVNPSIWCRKT